MTQIEKKALAIVAAEIAANYIDGHGTVQSARWISVRDLAARLELSREDLAAEIAVGERPMAIPTIRPGCRRGDHSTV